ncbi:MAG TPA: hypothetical protein VF818_06015 [Ktedonobacterales bacterium]
MSDFLKGLGNFLGKFAHGPEVSDTITRAFTVAGTPTVIAHDTFGSMRVATGGVGEVRVDATRKARGITTDATQADLEQLTVTFSQDGDTIRVDARATSPTVNLNRQVWCDLVLTVPAETHLDLKAEAGNVEVGATRGNRTAKVDAGNLEIRGGSGQIVATVNAGNVSVSDASVSGSSRLRVDAGQLVLGGSLADGASLDLRVNAGRIRLTLPASTSAHVEASADIGSISITGWNIPVVRNITAARASGDTAPNPRGTISARVDIGDFAMIAG